jgi:D-alanyl-lipoteichoic acid acyltransferase DltB (MBOAT superfamily)
MAFNSLQFPAFLLLSCGLYYLVPYRARLPVLLLTSCLFYAAYIPIYLLVLFALIVFDWSVGLAIGRFQGGKRRALLIASLTLNLSALAYFKYAGFFFGLAGIVLPLGISFHTFQSMAYVIEVYRGGYTAERNLLRYALYVMFWPQLVAGPIERPQNLLPQLRQPRHFDSARLVEGMRLMVWGFIKKMVIADRLEATVTPVFNSPHDFGGGALVLATLFFTFQIFCDFSGYTDIARGAAGILGFDLMENFQRPYLSTTFSDFWRRWHISLSTWFRDYLYFPLGGKSDGAARYAGNILIVFLLSGLWHGANWTFVVWGAWHGLLLVVSRLSGWEKRVNRGGVIALAGWAVTFLGVAVGWVFFRARSLSDAGYILTHLGRGSLALPDRGAALRGLALILMLMAAELLQGSRWWPGFFRARQRWMRWAVYYGGVLAWWWWGVFELRQFIYFNF